jgi:hypothetical protein
VANVVVRVAYHFAIDYFVGDLTGHILRLDIILKVVVVLVVGGEHRLIIGGCGLGDPVLIAEVARSALRVPLPGREGVPSQGPNRECRVMSQRRWEQRLISAVRPGSYRCTGGTGMLWEFRCHLPGKLKSGQGTG